MQELMKITTTPAQIAANFDEVEGQLREYLKQYDVVVSPDHVGDAKKLRTELRKQISELDNRIKDALKDASEPIRQADERRKQLVQLGRDVDAKIKEQVERCEAETKKKVQHLLFERRAALWQDYGVSDEFLNAEIGDLVKLTAITKKGKLAKSATDALDARVREDKALQDRTEKRLAELAGASYEAGLASPLTRRDVRPFLFANDDVYQANLQELLDTQAEREHKAEQRAKEQAERDARQKAEAEQREADRQRRIEDAAAAEHSTPQERAADPVPEPATVDTSAAEREIGERRKREAEELRAEKPATDGKVEWAVVATFLIRTPPQVSSDAIRAEARRVLEAAGIKTLRNVTAQRKPANAA